jgi:hypothetical protein
MAKKDHDMLVASLTAELNSPGVVAAIDKAIEEYRSATEDLLDLRKMAVRRHGDAGGNSTEINALQSGGNRRPTPTSTATVKELIESYLNDSRSPYPTLRHATRQTYVALIKRITETAADKRIADMKAPDVQDLYDSWAANGKIPMAHSLITMFRSLINFGATVLHDDACERLSFALHRMKFKAPQVKGIPLTAEQAVAIIDQANKEGLNSIALAQAFQFEGGMRQKDVIGEWVPESEPGESDTFDLDMKWVRGIRWEQISINGVLRYVTSKEAMPTNLTIGKDSLMMREIRRIPRPETGPVIVVDGTGLPWRGVEFRRKWRALARAVGIPDDVKNRNSRDAGSDDGEDDE